MARTTPRVEGATLVGPAGDDAAIAVGSPAWFAWLEHASTFAFRSAQGSFTARKERGASAGQYWKAYRKQAGKLHTAYLGKSSDLTFERLTAAAAALVRPPGPDRAGSNLPPAARPSQAAAAALPTGTITFLFTDIEGSTQLWEHHQQAMRPAIARHDAIVRAAVEAYGGVVFKMLGDGICAAFARAPDALTAAYGAQRALAAERWEAIGLPGGQPLRVRMALHTGTADLREGDYFGLALSRAARLLAAGHGGQILISRVTQELARDELPPEVVLRDLGEHRLRDLSRPQQVFQLLAPDLPADFPPLRTLPHTTNLPTQATSFVPRHQEVEATCALLRRGDVRLVTLTGPGGVGKTRLALRSAAELLDDFRDGVYFVTLAPIREPALVAPVVATTLGAKEVSGQPLLEALKSYLHDRQLLLLLDNFEQVLAAAPLIAELLATAPRLKALVTSRAVLHLSGEYELTVPPLALPDPRHLPALGALSQYAAVELFIERARATKSDFSVTNENAPAIAEICYRLDGLPLAIELAAARAKVLTPQALLLRLERRLPLLAGGPRDLPARQQTLRNTIDWSYQLLEPDEQRLFQQLAVFVGGCTPEAAEAIADCRLQIARAEQSTMLDCLAALVDKSLLRHENDHAGEPRFVMLETIREYALEWLEQSGEAEVISRRHALFFLALAEKAEPQLQGARQREWLERLEAEHDNLRAALGWASESGDAEIGLRLAGALCWFWFIHGHYTAGRRWVQEMRQLADQATAALRAKMLSGAGTLTYAQGDFAEAVAFHNQALALYRELGDQRGIAFTLNNLGVQAILQGEFARATVLYNEALPLAQAIGDRWLCALILINVGLLAREQGHNQEAVARYQESLALYKELGDRWISSSVLHNLGEVIQDQGDSRQARALYEESLHISREWGDKWAGAHSLRKLGQLARAEADVARAISLCLESLKLFWELGYKRGIAESVEELAALACTVEAYERAACLYGAAEALREASGAPVLPSDRTAYDRTVATVRARLGQAAFAAAWSAGRTMTPEQALVLAEQPVVPAAEPPIAPAPQHLAYPGGLTEREAEVLRLLAQGLSYTEIAKTLIISPRTVNRHLTSIYGKLGVTSRHAAARFAIDQHLV